MFSSVFLKKEASSLAHASIKRNQSNTSSFSYIDLICSFSDLIVCMTVKIRAMSEAEALRDTKENNKVSKGTDNWRVGRNAVKDVS